MHCEQHPRRPTGMETGVQNIQYLFMGGKNPKHLPSSQSSKSQAGPEKREVKARHILKTNNGKSSTDADASQLIKKMRLPWQQDAATGRCSNSPKNQIREEPLDPPKPKQTDTEIFIAASAPAK